MDKNDFKTILSTKKVWLFIIVVLLIIIAYLFLEKQNLKFSLIEYKSIPHIDLTDNLTISNDTGLFQGSIRGFVKFDNKNDQPKDLRQYYIIEPTYRIDKNSNQIFTSEQIIAMNYLPPVSINKADLVEKNNSNSALTLEDADGNQFFIDKISKEVTMRDVTGDLTRLITNNNKYRDFMWNFLRNK